MEVLSDTVNELQGNYCTELSNQITLTEPLLPQATGGLSYFFDSVTIIMLYCMLSFATQPFCCIDSDSSKSKCSSRKKSLVSNFSLPVHLYLVLSLCSVPGFPFYSPEPFFFFKHRIKLQTAGTLCAEHSNATELSSAQLMSTFPI